MTRTCGMGFYPDPGVKGAAQIKINGNKNQTTRLEVNGGSISLGLRVVAHRLYKSWWQDVAPEVTTGGVPTGALIAGQTTSNMFGTSSSEYQSYMSGHVPVISTGTAPDFSSNSFCVQVTNGRFDSYIKDMFRKWENLITANAGNTIAKLPDGNGGYIAGSDYGGTYASEGVYAFIHEPNVASSNKYPPKNAAEFIAAMKYIMQLYDGMGFSTKHIKFAVIISSNSAMSTWTIGAGANRIDKTGARPLDMMGCDLYYPRPESGDKSGGITNAGKTTFPSKFEIVRQWTLANMPANTPIVIGEYANRIITAGTSPDANWPNTWMTDSSTVTFKPGAATGVTPSSVTVPKGLIPYMQSATTKLANGDHCVRYMCQYVSTTTPAGGTDNSIIGDQLTLATSYEQAGFTLAQAQNGFDSALTAFGNPSMPTTLTPVTPTTMASSAITFQQATLTWSSTSPDTSYNLWKGGVRTQTGVSALTATVFPTGGQGLPQTWDFQITGVVNGLESALSTSAGSKVTVTFPAQVGTPPGTPTSLVISQITSTSAIASCTAPASGGTGGVSGYNWFLDGASNPTYSTTSPVASITGLAPGSSHGITVLAFNSTYGGGTATSSVPFTTTVGPDSTAPSVPGSPSTSGTITALSVPLQWTASVDPIISGQATSGLQNYFVYRSATADPNSGVKIGSPITTSFTDTAPLSAQFGTTDNYYSFSAIDNAGFESPQSTPLHVVVPAKVVNVGPTAVITVSPGSTVTVGQLVTFDATQSISGSGGTITNYAWDFGDGVITAFSSNPVITHLFATSAFYTVKLTVKDSVNVTNSVKTFVTVQSADTPILPYTGVPVLVKNAPVRAADVNNMTLALDEAASTSNDRLTSLENAISETGMPSELAIRHGGGVFMSTSSGAVGTSNFTVAPATGYVIRCSTLNGAPFSQVTWAQQDSSSVTGVTNSFWAVYDVDGNLVSAPVATDCSASWMLHQENTYIIDGGPFDPPLGTDDPANRTDGLGPSFEFFLYFYLATTTGANKPQLAFGSNLSLVVNMGCNNTATPSLPTIQSCPLFATTTSVPSVALNPPVTLGTLTPLGNSLLILLS